MIPPHAIFSQGEFFLPRFLTRNSSVSEFPAQLPSLCDLGALLLPPPNDFFVQEVQRLLQSVSIK